MDSNEMFADEEDGGRAQDDLRRQVSAAVLEHAAVITWDTVAIFPFSGAEMLEPEYCNRVGQVLLQLLALAVREGKVDERNELIADLHRLAIERRLPAERLFTFSYLMERTVLDELALSDTIGATSEAWPLVAQLVRRASFDLLGAYAERTQLEPSGAAIIDRLTTLYTRVMFEAVLAKELERAGRFGYAVSVILFDVDRLSDINKEHGYGVGDKILERLGITLRTYFRQHDWVARYGEDSIIVLLTQTEPDNAAELAERVRQTIEERLELKDHRDGRTLTVTLSAAVINAHVEVGDAIDPERLIADAEAAVEPVKKHRRYRDERVGGS